MKKVPLKIEKRLQLRKEQDSFRKLGKGAELIDFSSNDYLGFGRNKNIFEEAQRIIENYDGRINGSGGSRLLTGNHSLYEVVEDLVARYHQANTALIFNSGYDANLGFFGSVPQREDVIFYDELSHASIRDGISLSKARAYKFIHNDCDDLEARLKRYRSNFPAADIYIVTEAVFSMDGDSPNLKALAELSEVNGCYLIVDEAHSAGVVGLRGRGLVEELGIEDLIFARLLTYGKAFGAHGAAILGSEALRDYLINFARSFIYTTALPPHSVATLIAAYRYLEEDGMMAVDQLQQNIHFFRNKIENKNLGQAFIKSNSAIHSCIIPGNVKVKQIALDLSAKNFDVKPILSPTVPAGGERLRFCIHSFNTKEEMETVVSLLSRNVN